MEGKRVRDLLQQVEGYAAMARQTLGQSHHRYGTLQDVRRYVSYITAWMQEVQESLDKMDREEKED